jgi:hypothetical protein
MILSLNQFGIHQLAFQNTHIVIKQCIYSAVIVVINSILSMMNHAIVSVLHQVDLPAEVTDDVGTLIKWQNISEKFG